MSTTAVALLVLGAGTIAQFVLYLFLLKLGAKWTRIQGATTGRALLATFAIYLVQVAGFTVGALCQPILTAIDLFVAFSLAVACLLLPPLMIRAIFRATWRQAVLTWLLTWLAPLFGVLLVLLLIRPYLFEAFKTPGNSMAPTLLGNHFTATCPQCGKPAYGSPSTRYDPPMECLTICDAFHVHASTSALATSEGDRFMVTKYLRPRRWDLIAFRFPGDPSINYVKRLVGLPGETVVIKDGAVWIDGHELEPPPSLKGVNYVTEFPNMLRQVQIAGEPDRPAVLGPGEYFVLGDFSPQSSDSRLWEKGAAGHPPYAVPESYIVGVVTHIYWPPGRWRVMR